MQDVHLEHHVLVQEIGRRCGVCRDPADFCRREKDVFRPFLSEKSVYVILTAEIQRVARPCHKVGVALRLERTHDRRAHHAAVSGYEDFGVFLHPFIFHSAWLPALPVRGRVRP